MSCITMLDISSGTKFYHAPKESIIDRTSQIIKSLREEDAERQSKSVEVDKDLIRLSTLYGRGLRKVKALKGKKTKQREDDTDFVFDEEHSISAKDKLNHCQNLFERGTQELEMLRFTHITLSELRNLLYVTYTLKLNQQEMAAVAADFGSVEGKGIDTSTNFIKFLTSLKRYADDLRNADWRRRMKEREDMDEARIERIRGACET